MSLEKYQVALDLKAKKMRLKRDRQQERRLVWQQRFSSWLFILIFLILGNLCGIFIGINAADAVGCKQKNYLCSLLRVRKLKVKFFDSENNQEARRSVAEVPSVEQTAESEGRFLRGYLPIWQRRSPNHQNQPKVKKCCLWHD